MALNFDALILPENLINIQPMTGPIGKIFTMKVYDDNGIQMKRKLPKMPKMGKTIPIVEVPQAELSVVDLTPVSEDIAQRQLEYIPAVDPLYMPVGNFDDIKRVLESGHFFPIYLQGPTGCAKTTLVEQVCAQLGRPLVRANIINDTDEDDLIGGFRLKNGETVFHEGPVTIAMELGAVLLLDEVDLGSPKMLCLQPPLEGKQIFIKKTGRIVKPQKGFTVIATANTKGKGSEDGRFIGANNLNDAFLDRFPITMEQDYPNAEDEKIILEMIISAFNGGMPITEDNDTFIECLIKWAEVSRQSFKQSIIQEVISTRRLTNIIKSYLLFDRNREKAIKLALTRFDEESSKGLMEMYSVLDKKIYAEREVTKRRFEEERLARLKAIEDAKNPKKKVDVILDDIDWDISGAQPPPDELIASAAKAIIAENIEKKVWDGLAPPPASTFIKEPIIEEDDDTVPF